jgi:tRNA dimethylallyltransferase
LWQGDLVCNYAATEKTENLDIKNQLEEEYEKHGKEFMWEKLNKLAPEEAAKIPVGNYYMVLRALEVLQVTGKPKSQVAQKSKPFFEYELIVLNPDRKELYERIEHRIDEQIEQGLIDETKNLIDQYGPDLHALTSLGYKEINSYLKGECSLDHAIKLFKQKTRNYAKRQLTWFRRYDVK